MVCSISDSSMILTLPYVYALLLAHLLAYMLAREIQSGNFVEGFDMLGKVPGDVVQWPARTIEAGVLDGEASQEG